MTRKARFVLNALVPAVLATAIMALPTLLLSLALAFDPDLRTSAGVGPVIGGFVMILTFAYAFGLVPSLIHAGLMDLATRRWPGPAHSERRLLASTASGAIAGGLIIVIFGSTYGFTPSLAAFIGVGALTGFLNGLVVGCLDRWSAP